MQSTNNLLAFYNWLLSYSSADSQNVAELTFGGYRILFTRDPGHIKTILTGKFAHFGKGPMFHDAWHPFLGDSIFTTDGHLWQNSRSLIRPMFTKDRIRDIDLFEHWADVFMKKLPLPGQPVDVCDLFYRWTLDVATDFLLGRSVGSMERHVSPEGG